MVLHRVQKLSGITDLLGRRDNVAFFVVSYLCPLTIFPSDESPLEGDRCVEIGKNCMCRGVGVTAYQRS